MYYKTQPTMKASSSSLSELFQELCFYIRKLSSETDTFTKTVLSVLKDVLVLYNMIDTVRKEEEEGQKKASSTKCNRSDEKEMIVKEITLQRKRLGVLSRKRGGGGRGGVGMRIPTTTAMSSDEYTHEISRSSQSSLPLPSTPSMVQRNSVVALAIRSLSHNIAVNGMTGGTQWSLALSECVVAVMQDSNLFSRCGSGGGGGAGEEDQELVIKHRDDPFVTMPMRVTTVADNPYLVGELQEYFTISFSHLESRASKLLREHFVESDARLLTRCITALHDSTKLVEIPQSSLLLSSASTQCYNETLSLAVGQGRRNHVLLPTNEVEVYLPTDPVSKTPITIAAKSVFCKHNQPFDLHVFLKHLSQKFAKIPPNNMKERMKLLACPICSVKMTSLLELRIDAEVTQLLNSPEVSGAALIRVRRTRVQQLQHNKENVEEEKMEEEVATTTPLKKSCIGRSVGMFTIVSVDDASKTEASSSSPDRGGGAVAVLDDNDGDGAMMLMTPSGKKRQRGGDGVNHGTRAPREEEEQQKSTTVLTFDGHSVTL